MKRLLCLFALFTLVSPLLAYKTFKGNPRWPLKSGYHLTVNLHPDYFSRSSGWYSDAVLGVFDWSGLPGSSFRARVVQQRASYQNHADGINTWVRRDLGSSVGPSVSFVMYRGAVMLDCDVVFNTSTRWYWQANVFDPSANRHSPAHPISIRGVARAMAGRSAGLDHENGYVSCTNRHYSHGAHVQHTAGLGLLPHAEDRQGIRALYRGTGTEVNLKALAYMPPKTASSAAWRRWVGGSVRAGARLSFECQIENCGNVDVANYGVRWFLSRDKRFDNLDVRIQGAVGPRHPAHATWTIKSSGLVPANLVEGTYYLGMVVDPDNRLRERYENDNVALLGQINVVGTPDLAVEATRATSRATRGARVAISVTVRNRGNGTSPTFRAGLFSSSQNETRYNNIRSWWQGSFVGPSLRPGQVITRMVYVVVPNDACGGLKHVLHVHVDDLQRIVESNENNNVGRAALYVQWPQTSAYQIGVTQPVISSADPASRYSLCSHKSGSLPQNTWYVFLWGCSGTSPGLTIPGLGVLRLNFDACTNLGLSLFGTPLFDRLIGPQPPASFVGPVGRLVGGTWLRPVRGRSLHWSALYLVPGKNLVGVANSSVRMLVR